MQRLRRRTLLTFCLYAWAMVRQFRWTLLLLALTVSIGAACYAIPELTAEGQRGKALTQPIQYFYMAWMAMLAQPVIQPVTWYQQLIGGLYPLLGVLLVGEGVVRLAMLMISRRDGEKEWMRVMASTYRDHVVLCGIGHLGFRVLQQLVESKVALVAIESNPEGRFVAAAKGMGAPVLIGDMKEDKHLLDAGVPHARVIIIATNDDMANIEVALDARRMNKKIRILMRQFDQQIAAKISSALSVDVAFSASSLAAPIVVAMSLDSKILATFTVGGVQYVTTEIAPEAGSALVGKKVAEVESTFNTRVLALTRAAGAHTQSPPPPDAAVIAGDTLVFYTEYAKMATLAAGAKQLK
jgi:voltage-gated potassium channel